MSKVLHQKLYSTRLKEKLKVKSIMSKLSNLFSDCELFGKPLINKIQDISVTNV